MHRSMLIAIAVLSVACAKKEAAPAADTAAAHAPAMAAAAPAPVFSLADAAGKWEYTAKSRTGDTVLVKAELNATTDPNGWTMTFTGRKPEPMKVTVSGDSALVTMGPYESVLRKGVQVTTVGTLHMMNGKLEGHSVAHYNTKGADSVRHLVIEATRKP